MKKRFEVQLDEETHSALKDRAEVEGASMSAVCREALDLHLQEPPPKLSFVPRPDSSIPVPDQDEAIDPFIDLGDYLSLLRSVPITDESFEDSKPKVDYDTTFPNIYNVPSDYNEAPEAFYRTTRPRRTIPFYSTPEKAARPPADQRYVQERSWLDDLWT